jgi:leucyl-tRNA synthetase
MGFFNELQKFGGDPAVFGYVMKTLVTLFSPFAPHIMEELWGKMGKGFVLTQKWPKSDKKLVDIRLMKMEELVEQTRSDIHDIIKIVGKKPEKIRIYVSPVWKYQVYREILKSEDPKKIVTAIMKNPAFSKYGKDALRFAQYLAKDMGKLQEILTEREEFQALKEAASMFRKEFNCDVEVIAAYTSRSEKALRAEPGKPGIEIVSTITK